MYDIITKLIERVGSYNEGGRNVMSVENEYMIKEYMDMVSDNNGYKLFEIKPAFGEGFVECFTIMSGLYLFYSDFNICDSSNNNRYIERQDQVVEIDYCIEGTWICQNNKGLKKSARQNKVTYFAGSESYLACNTEKVKYKSINIYGYKNELIQSLNDIFIIEPNDICDLYNSLNNSGGIVIENIREEQYVLLTQLYRYIKLKEINMLKLKSLELVLLELESYKMHKQIIKPQYRCDLVMKVKRIRNDIENNLKDRKTIDYYARAEGMSASTLKKCFKELSGDSLYSYKRKCRMKKARELLLEADKSIYQIAEEVGYAESSMFAKAFKKMHGITPNEYRKKKI